MRIATHPRTERTLSWGEARLGGRRARRIAVAVTGLALAAGAFALVLPVVHVAALGYAVDETADEGLAVSSSPVCLTASGHCSLRAAIEASNNLGGSNTISLPAGTYDLSASLGELQVGPSGGTSLTISGAGAATTVIDAVQDGSCTSLAPSACFRVFDVDPNVLGGVAFSADGIRISGGRTGETGGAGILNGTGTAAQASDSTSLSNCVVTDNVTYAGSAGAVPGGGLAQTYGSVTVDGCTFSNNTASLVGGAVDMEAPTNGGSPTLLVTNSTFSGNTATIGGGVSIANTVAGTIAGSAFTGNTSTGNGGGAIGVNSGSLSLAMVTLTANQAQGTGNGGAIYTGGGSTTIQYSRIYGNTASLGHTAQVFNNVAGAATTAENDWWGDNSGPGSGISNFGVTAWQVLTNIASPNPINTDQSSTITASLDSTNLGGSIAPANHLPDGIPASFADGALGSVSPITAALSAGSASTTYTAGVLAGIDSVPATIDGQTVDAPITITFTSQIANLPSRCGQFAADEASTLSQVKYATQGGTIHGVGSDGFFYWVAVTSSGGRQSLAVTQSTSEASRPFLLVKGAAYAAGCVKVASHITQSASTVTVQFNGRGAGSTFYIGLKFTTSNVIGEPKPAPVTTVTYLFSTSGVTGSTSELDLVKR